MTQLSVDAGWGNAEVPEVAIARLTLKPTVGLQRSAEPNITVLSNVFLMQEFLLKHTSLNVVYLPAERRLLPSGQATIDLNQLSEMFAWQKNAESSRSAVQNYGRLDDQEFEQFAKALCVAGTLPDEEGAEQPKTVSRIQWPEFVETVNGLIAPKRLLPLTRQHPDQLRIETASGQTHLVQELSSGERQALIIISRVLRAGAGHTLVLIDEPDAYLHPHLSQRLMQALQRGIGPSGQLIVATHSPAILDNLVPSAIVRLGHQEPPRLVADEAERVDLYRSAGFRASALTQLDLLLIVEGESDTVLLSLLFPELTRAAVRSAGGRPRVFREVEQLLPYALPVLGAVDRDLLAPDPPESIRPYVTVWPTADIEGLFLSDTAAIQAIIDLGLLKKEFQSAAVVKDILGGLLEGQKDNAVAEMAQRMLREAANLQWPTPRGESPITRLREATNAMALISSTEVEEAIGRAGAMWDTHQADLWTIVRGKAILPQFANRASEMRSGRALLEAIARARPALNGLHPFAATLRDALLWTVPPAERTGWGVLFSTTN